MKHTSPQLYKYFGDRYIHRPYQFPNRNHSIPLPSYVAIFTSSLLHLYIMFIICRPGYKHWKSMTDRILYMRYKCMSIDICNTCTVFANHIQDVMDEMKEDEEKMGCEDEKDDDEEMEDEQKMQQDKLKRLQQHFKAHLDEASFGYQANAAMIAHAKKSWDNVKILKTYPKGSSNDRLRQLLSDLNIKPGSTIHVTIDWDRDRNEFQRQHKKFYNKEKPQFVSLNIKIEPETDKGTSINIFLSIFTCAKIMLTLYFRK